MMNKKLIQWFIVSTVFVAYYGMSEAYRPQVHERITEEAIQRNIANINEKIQNYTGLEGVDDSVNNKKIIKWIKDGSKKEDYTIDILTSHFYNPITNQGLNVGGDVVGESAYDIANNLNNKWSWKKAREYFYEGLTLTSKTEREKALADSFRAIGQVMHLVEDMSVPSHTREDAHGLLEPYEKYTNDKIASLNYTLEPFSYWNQSISSGAPKQFWDTESYDGSIPYTSGNIGLAEYTNANFASSDTIFSETFDTSDPWYFPFPRKSSTVLYEEIDDQTGKKTKYFRIVQDTENIEHFAVASKFHNLFEGWPNFQRLFLSLNDKSHADYAKKLIPRAVGYSAGLMNYFFRGEIDLMPDYDTGTGYVIVNNSEEELSGTFELYYDNIHDERIKIWSGELTLGTGEPPIIAYAGDWADRFIAEIITAMNNRSDVITFEQPEDIKDPCKYILVFRGRMGNEEGAVVGKVADLSVYTTACRFCSYQKIEEEMDQYLFYNELGSGTITVTDDIPPVVQNFNGGDIYCKAYEKNFDFYILDPNRDPEAKYPFIFKRINYNPVGNKDQIYYYFEYGDYYSLNYYYYDRDSDRSVPTPARQVNGTYLSAWWSRPWVYYNSLGSLTGSWRAGPIPVQSISGCNSLKALIGDQHWTGQQTTTYSKVPNTHIIDYMEQESMNIASIEPNGNGYIITLVYDKTRTETENPYTYYYEKSWTYTYTTKYGTQSGSGSSQSRQYHGGGTRLTSTLEAYERKFLCENNIFTEIQ